jgi:hypothetical protein
MCSPLLGLLMGIDGILEENTIVDTYVNESHHYQQDDIFKFVEHYYQLDSIFKSVNRLSPR